MKKELNCCCCRCYCCMFIDVIKFTPPTAFNDLYWMKKMFRLSY
jgi:hypothetical protein